MKPKSAKQKGRRLQNQVREDLINVLEIPSDQIRTAIMGEKGADIKDYSKMVPLSIECKNVERLDIWKAIDQSEANADISGIPCVVFKKNGREAYAALPWKFVMALLVIWQNGLVTEEEIDVIRNTGGGTETGGAVTERKGKDDTPDGV